MPRTDFFTEEDECNYVVHCRKAPIRQREARRYSPRFEKQAAPTGSRGGIHRRGKQGSQISHVAA